VFSTHGENIWEPLVRHECLATFVLSISEGIVEHRTPVHPARAFTSIRRDCVGWFRQCVEGRMSWWFIMGERPRGAPPLR
jgi:hypothetical protein